jgi:hypothetical protein
MEPRRRLSDILNGQGDDFRNNWNNTTAADDFAPLPPGKYLCRIINGEPGKSKKKGTPSYRLTFKVKEGDYAGRNLWDDLWLTPAALPGTKRDLAKIGVTDFAQLDQPLPQGILVMVSATIDRDDDGNERNRVRILKAVGIEPPDPFAPSVDGRANPWKRLLSGFALWGHVTPANRMRFATPRWGRGHPGGTLAGWRNAQRFGLFAHATAGPA